MEYGTFLKRLAAVAAAETLPRFRRRNQVDNKLSGGFDPVTEADREAERAIRALITAEQPEHGILGEEHGLTRGDARHVWVIDPIDGTRAFISGLPVWGTLIGLLEDGDAIAGAMSQPFTGEFYWADGSGAFYEGRDGSHFLKTRDIARLADATLFTTTPSLFTGPKRTLYDRIESLVRLPRYGADCYAFAMLAAGHADIVMEAGLQPYDIVALIPIVEQAGGVITTLEGDPAEGGGDIVAAATPQLHEAVLEEWARGA